MENYDDNNGDNQWENYDNKVDMKKEKMNKFKLLKTEDYWLTGIQELRFFPN